MSIFVYHFFTDQRMQKFTTSTKSRRWNRKILSYQLDVSRCNGQTIFSKNKTLPPRKYDSADFAWNLAKQLVWPHVLERKTLTFRYLPADIKKSIDYFLTINSTDENQNNLLAEEEDRGGNDDEAGGGGDNNVNQNDGQNVVALFPYQAEVQRSKRCDKCCEAIVGPNYKEKYNKLTKSGLQCQKCKMRVCKTHKIVICIDCGENLMVKPPPVNPELE